MAIRNIVKKGDEILGKISREVTSFDDRLHILLDDMMETMRRADGVGLAAVQVGVLRRVVVIETEPGNVIELINPKIIASSGSQIGNEGCLSVPDVNGVVKRPKFVTVSAQDRNGKEFTISGEDLLARAFCHELDHLDGHLFTEKVIEYVK